MDQKVLLEYSPVPGSQWFFLSSPDASWRLWTRPAPETKPDLHIYIFF